MVHAARGALPGSRVGPPKSAVDRGLTGLPALAITTTFGVTRLQVASSRPTPRCALTRRCGVAVPDTVQWDLARARALLDDRLTLLEDIAQVRLGSVGLV